MQQRIYGVESEYALCYSSSAGESQGEWDDEALLKHLEEPTALILESLKQKGNAVAGEFLGNGGRLYIDRGGHPEYATPECATVKDLVTHEKAGDRLMQELVEVARSLFQRRGRPGKLAIFKNNVDSFGNTYGNHENYLTTPRALARIEAIIPFLVTRQVFAGAGKVGPMKRAGEAAYQLTQRADFFGRIVNDRIHGSRGIINNRRRGIPQPGENRRLHIIVGDCNMSESAIGLKVGTTGLVLRLLEEGTVGGIPTLASPVQALKTISRAPDSRLSIEGRKQKYTAREIQSIHLEKVDRLLCRNGRNREEEDITAQWASILDGLKNLKLSMETGVLEDDPDDLKRRIDWVLKLWLLNRIGTKDRPDVNDTRRRILDLRYHDLDPETGLFDRCQALGLVDRVVEEEEVCRAQVDPPRETRAWTRGKLIQSMSGKNVEIRVESWDKVRLSAPRMGSNGTPSFTRRRRSANSLVLTWRDPFQSEDPTSSREVGDFLEALDDRGASRS